LSISTIVSTVVAACTTAILFYGCFHATKGEMTVGTMFLFFTLSTSTWASLGVFSGILTQASEALTSIEQIDDLLAVPKQYSRSSASPFPPMTDIDCMLCEQLTFGYHAGTNILTAASASFNAGEVTVVQGVNGSGKSSLAIVLAGLMQPFEGTVSLRSGPTRVEGLAALQANVSWLSHEPSLLNISIRDNLTLGNGRLSAADLETALQLVGASEFISALPGGIDFQVGDDGCQLSVGQRQRLAIARALLLKRPILILDESMNSIDPAGELRIVAALRALNWLKILILITHRKDLSAFADRILTVQDGVVHEATRTHRPHDSARAALLGS
jgi:ATP-binding cassette subfamily B protein